MLRKRHCDTALVAGKAIHNLENYWIAASALPPRNDKNKAFTLLELNIVLLIIATIMGGAMLIFNQSLEQRQIDETKLKMEALQKALLDYRFAFNRLPCPADITQNMDATSSNYYGVEAANPGVCSGGTPTSTFTLNGIVFTGDTTNGSSVITNVSSTDELSIGTLLTGTGITSGSYIISIDSATQITMSADATASNTTINIRRSRIVAGMVPTKTLKLPDDYAIDGWGNRILYKVDLNVTSISGFTNVPVTDSAVNRIIIAGNTVTGTMTNGSAVVTSVSSTSNLAVGSIIASSNMIQYVQDNTVVLSVDSSSQITLSKTAISSRSNVSLGVVKSASAVYALVSFGKNMHGAFPRDGGTKRFRNHITPDPDELINCSCGNNGNTPLGGFTTMLVQKPLSIGAFDDIVVFSTRADMRAGHE